MDDFMLNIFFVDLNLVLFVFDNCLGVILGLN